MMRWTTDTPTEPGWYWVDDRRYPIGVICLRMRSTGELFWRGETIAVLGECRWSGPIPEPEEG